MAFDPGGVRLPATALTGREPATISVVGDALLDVMALPEGALRPGGDVPGEVRVAPGGQGANIAVRLARRGRHVRLVTGIADDAAGRLVREALAAEGVDVVAVAVDRTGTVVAVVDGTGERSMISRRPTLGRAVSDSVAATPSSWLVVSGYLLLEDGAADVAAALAASGARCALIGCAVPAGLEAPWRAAAAALRPDLVVQNRDERDRVPAEGGTLTVVTDAGGAIGELGDARIEARAAPIPGEAVDTTGAGDALAASLLHALVDRWPPTADGLRAALATALVAAGEVTRVIGAQARTDADGTGRLPG